MKTIILSLFVIMLTLSNTSFAEVIDCKNDKISLKASPSTPTTTPNTLKAKLKTKFWKKPSDLTLKIAPRGEKINYVDYWDSNNFWLSLGKYQGSGYYPNAVLTLREDGKQNKYQVECELKGSIPFKNYCEETNGNNPQNNLFVSVENKNEDLLNATLACNVDVNVENKNGCSPLLVLIDRNCGTGVFDPFAVADIKNMVLALLDTGAMINSIDPSTQETALIKAVRIQDLDSVKHLIDAESDVDAQDKDGFTPLMRAVETRSLKMVELLVESGSSLDIKNSAGLTALQLAQEKKYHELYVVLSGLNTVVVQGNKSGVCKPMEFSLQLNKPNRIILRTENPMLMLVSKELKINLMAGADMEVSTTITPQKAGAYKMTCGPSMGDGNPEGKIIVQ